MNTCDNCPLWDDRHELSEMARKSRQRKARWINRFISGISYRIWFWWNYKVK